MKHFALGLFMNDVTLLCPDDFIIHDEKWEESVEKKVMSES